MFALAMRCTPHAAAARSSSSGSPICSRVARSAAPAVDPDLAPREGLGVEIPEHEVRVGEGGPPAAPAVAHGPRLRARALRADRDQAEPGGGDAAAARPDLDELHGRDVEGQPAPLAKVHPVHLEGGGDRGLAVVDDPDLGGGPAHVEGDDVAQAFAGPRRPAGEHPGGRPRLDDVDRVLAGERGGGEAPVGLHDAELAGEAEGGEGGLQLGEEPADDRLHVGVGDDGARALVLAAPGRDVRGERYRHLPVPRRTPQALGEDRPRRPLVGRVGVGMEQADGDALHPVGGEPLGDRRDRVGVKRRQHLAVGADPLVHLVDRAPRHEGARLVEPEVVGVEALRAPHDEHVAESAGGDEGGTPALAFEDGVGRDGGRDQDLPDVGEAERSNRREAVDALQGRAGRVGGGAQGLREPRGAARFVPEDEVGERAAGVYAKPQHGSSPFLPPFPENRVRVRF